MIELVLAIKLQFTLPRYDAWTDSLSRQVLCARSAPWPCTDLDSVLVHGVARWMDRDSILYRAQVRGMEGAAYSVDVYPDTLSRPWVIYVTTKDLHGNESCSNQSLGFGFKPGVPHP